jgi:hypothetical protein
LLSNPCLFLEDCVIAAQEARIYHGTNLVKIPDGLIIDKYGDFSLIEYKTNYSGRDTAIKQLRMSANAIFNQLGIIPELYFVHGKNSNYDIENVTREIVDTMYEVVYNA